MKGIHISIIGICVGLLGIAFASTNFLAICATSAGLILAFVGYFFRNSQ